MMITLKRLFEWRLRGFRVINIFAVVCLLAMVFSTYIAKAGAARESQEIGDLERDIAEKSQRVRLLRAEAARLENPARLEALSRQAGLLPPDVDRMASEGELNGLSPLPEPAPPVAPAPAEAAPVDDEAIDPMTPTPSPEAAR